MTTRLFRKEAVDARSGRRFSNTTLVTPLSFSAYALFAGVIAASIAVFLIVGRYSPKDTVRGYVTTTEADVKVYPQSDGTVLAVLVADGDPVAEGQSLVRLGTSRSIARTAESRRSVLRALRAERAALLQRIESEKDSFVTQEASERAEVASLVGRLSLLDGQRQSLLEATGIARREAGRLTALRAADFVSERARDNARSTLVEYELRLKDLALTEDDIRSAIRRNEASLLELPHRRDRRVAELDAMFHELSVRMAEAIERDKQTVVAPSAGIVTGILVRKGQTVSPDSTLMSLIPRDGVYYAEVLIPTRTIAFIRRGAAVRIRFDAFPYQSFGTFEGTIGQVARTTILPADKSFPVPVSGAVYPARVLLAEQHVVGRGEAHRLQAGMTLTADILREDRRIIDWMFDPLLGAARRL